MWHFRENSLFCSSLNRCVQNIVKRLRWTVLRNDGPKYAPPKYDGSKYAPPKYDGSKYAPPKYDWPKYASPKY